MSFNDYVQRVLALVCERPAPTLDRHQKMVFAILEAEFEILQGGLPAYVYNSSGEHIPAHIEAFREIGAHRTAKALGRFFDLITERGDPEDAEVRLSAFKSIASENGDVCDEIEQLITDHAEPWGEMLEQYDNENIHNPAEQDAAVGLRGAEEVPHNGTP